MDEQMQLSLYIILNLNNLKMDQPP
jgi:hypothetical protein